jgi:hypothetical protein
MMNSTTDESPSNSLVVSLLTVQESFHQSAQDGYSGTVFVHLLGTDRDLAVTCGIKRHNHRPIVK